MQYFCLHGILPFSKSYREIESTWSTAKCRGRKSFDTWCYMVACATLCVSFFYQDRKQLCFSKTYPEIESTWLINSTKEKIVLSRDSRELFLQRFVKGFDQNWNHVEARNKEQTPQLTLLYCGRTLRCSHQRCCIRNLLLKFLQYPQETLLLESIFIKVADL